MIKKLPLVLLMYVLGCTTSLADDAQGNHAVWGVGGSSCNAFRVAKASNTYSDYKSFIMGYLTATNTLTPAVNNITGKNDFNYVLNWIDDFCKKNVMESFDHAILALIAELQTTLRKPGESKNETSGWGNSQ